MEAVVTVNKRFCKGCGICIHFCPKKILVADELGKPDVIDQEKCIKCRQCELRCPDFAIKVKA